MTDREITDQNIMLNHFPEFSGAHSEEELNRRLRLLFLAPLFPPLRTMACVRTWNIAKYLARLGWNVTVVTPHPSVWRWRHVDNPDETEANLKREGIRRVLTDHRWRFLSPKHLNCWKGFSWFADRRICRKIARYLGIDSEIGWIKAAELACSTLTPKSVDVILASGPPFAAFKLARRLSDRLGRPYVLDYRDPWTGNPHATRPAIIQEEVRLLAGCAAVTIVSPSWGLAMDHRFSLGPRLHVVTNGYDPEELADVEPHDFGHFAIVYTGHFYPPKRVISPVMAALKRLEETVDSKAREWYFHYYGEQENHIQEEAERFGVMERVVLHGWVPRAEALSAVRGAGVAVVITSVAEEVTIEDKGIMTGKVFEALGLGTLVLLVAPSGSDAKVMAETTGLVQSFNGSDIDGMASFLTDVMFGRCQALKPKNLEAYAWTNIAKRLDAVLRGVYVSAFCNKSEISSG